MKVETSKSQAKVSSKQGFGLTKGDVFKARTSQMCRWCLKYVQGCGQDIGKRSDNCFGERSEFTGLVFMDLLSHFRLEEWILRFMILVA